jgi:hypothetical protein
VASNQIAEQQEKSQLLAQFTMVDKDAPPSPDQADTAPMQSDVLVEVRYLN